MNPFIINIHSLDKVLSFLLKPRFVNNERMQQKPVLF